jgi:hypothetical protein
MEFQRKDRPRPPITIVRWIVHELIVGGQMDAIDDLVSKIVLQNVLAVV